jgi:large subunit ribosomal protein L7/L12
METIMAENSRDKLVEQIGNLTLLELADLLKSLEEKFDISAAMPMGAVGETVATGGETAAKEEEKSEYKVTLQDMGSDKIKVIKALRKVIPNLELSKARKMAEEAPTVVVEAVSKEEATKIKGELEAAGAKVTLS